MGCMDWNGTKVRRKFYWIDNTPVEGSYSIWAGGEPNNSGGSEKCVQMYGNDPKGKTWNDFSCEVGVNDAPVIVCQRARAMLGVHCQSALKRISRNIEERYINKK